MSASCDRCRHPVTAHTAEPGKMWLHCARNVEDPPGSWRRCTCTIAAGDCEFCGHPVASHVSAGFMWRTCAYQNGRLVSPVPCGCMI